MELTLPVTLAVLGGALLHASWNAIVKASADKQLDAIANSIGSGAISIAVALWLPAPSLASLPWIAGSMAVHVLYYRFLAGAYRWGDLSYTYPVMRGGGPMLVALASTLLFAEALAAQHWAGVLIICGGVLALAHGAHDPRATAFAAANAVVIAAYTLIDATGARASDAPLSYALWLCAGNGLVNAAIGFAQRGAELPAYVRARWLRALLGGACSMASYAIALWAMTRAPVALVAVLRETSVIFAALLGALFLRERMTRRRLVATGAVLAGLVVLKL
ncbi:MAG TPA: DMT family transporter [Burkholderiales bacterium]|nr:DMT family transporter [Burkholderiales bacterium]